MRISICIIHQSTLFVGRDNLDLTSGTLSKLSGVDSTGGMSGTCGWSSKQLQLPRANFVQTSVRVCGHAHTWYPVENGRIHPEVPSLSKSLQDLTGVLKCCTSTVYKNVYSQKPGIPERWPYLRLMSWPVLPTWHFLTFQSVKLAHGASVGKLCHICHNSEAVSSRARRSASGRQGSRCGVLGELHPHDAWENMMNMARWCEGISRYIQNISSLEPQIIPQTDARKPTIGGGRSGFQDIYSRFVLSVPMYLLGMPRKASVR